MIPSTGAQRAPVLSTLSEHDRFRTACAGVVVDGPRMRIIPVDPAVR